MALLVLVEAQVVEGARDEELCVRVYVALSC